MKGIATFKIVNNSDIAINANLKHSLTGTFAPETEGGERAAMDEEEILQLDTDFSWLDTTTSEVIADEVVTITKGNSQEAQLTFEFLSTDEDGSNDNKYQGCNFTIDTLLTATQNSIKMKNLKDLMGSKKTVKDNRRLSQRNRRLIYFRIKNRIINKKTNLK